MVGHRLLWRRDRYPAHRRPGPRRAAIHTILQQRGTKLGAYEGGIRTPLVVRWPAVIRQRGAITTQPGHVIDFMA
ncbi:MAG: sulfatase-like hydrolase/transferase, partial [Planctomycetaceae bacterium]|nr:sulfatase-like hydrolase/transferase [Planctomycetaceae bacterium]